VHGGEVLRVGLGATELQADVTADGESAVDPMLRTPDAVPKMTLTSPSVSMASVSMATHIPMCGVGSVAPLMILPYVHWSTSDARIAPASWATM